MDLGQVIYQRRIKLGISQEAVYKAAFPDSQNESGRAYISRIESGNRQPSLDALYALAKALHTRPSDLLKEAGL